MIEVMLARRIPVSLNIRLNDTALSFSDYFKAGILMSPWRTLTYDEPPIRPTMKNIGHIIPSD